MPTSPLAHKMGSWAGRHFVRFQWLLKRVTTQEPTSAATVQAHEPTSWAASNEVGSSGRVGFQPVSRVQGSQFYWLLMVARFTGCCPLRHPTGTARSADQPKSPFYGPVGCRSGFPLVCTKYGRLSCFLCHIFSGKQPTK